VNPELPIPPYFERAAPPPPPNVGTPVPPAPPSGALARLIAEFRAGQRKQLWIESLLWGTAAAVAALVASGFAGRGSLALGGALLALAPTAWLAAVAILGLLRARRQVGDAARAARTLGHLAPSLGTDALAAVELETELRGDPRFSRDLARAFLDSVDRRAAPLRAADFEDTASARRAGVALLAVLLVAAVCLALWMRPWLAGVRAVWRAASGEAPQLRYEPITGDIELSYRYPDYTGLQPRTVTGTTGDISAPAGTEVALRTRSDRPVRRAEVVVNGAALPLEVEGERALHGRFVLEAPGSYHFRFLSALGGVTARGPDLPINVEVDVPPKVELVAPQVDLEIDAGEKVTLRYEAQDDFGITALELVFRTPGGKEQRVPLPHENGRHTRDSYPWDLGALSLHPGDRVSYHVEAKDNDARSGAKRGVSRTQVVRVYSAAEHRREAVKKAEAMWERLVVQLADRLEGGDLAEPMQAPRVQAGQRVDEAGVVLSQDLRVTAAEISQERDAPQELVAAMVNIAEAYGRTVRTTRDVRRIFLRYSNRSDLAGDFGRRLQAAARDEVSELEKDVLFLETMIDRRKLDELRELAQELKRERRELTSLVEEFRDSKDAEVREKVLRQIKELRERIAELARRMDELAQGIRDEHLNAEAMRELLDKQDLASALDEVERLMREGKTDEALAKLQELSMQLDELAEGLEQADENFGDPELAQKFAEFTQELQATTEAQQRVANDTRQLRDRYRQKIKERLERKGESMRDQLLKKVEEAARDYQQVDPDRLRYQSERQLEQVQSELEHAANALKVEDFDLAAESAARAERAAEELRLFGEQQAEQDQASGNPPEVRAESRRMAERLKRDERLVREVNQALQQLFPPAGSMMSEADQQRLRQLSEEQQKLEQRGQGLQQRMEEMSEMASLFDEEAMQQMEQAGQRMGEAAQRMQQRDPARGYGEQQAALEQLQRFQQQMREAQRQRGKGRGLQLPMPMMAGSRGSQGSANSREDVEIPDENQYQAPKEFRKDLLDAMKQGAPEKYQDQVKRYYEELVR
jgi:hypothetical protein